MPMSLAFLSAASAIAFAVVSVRNGFISCADAVPHRSTALTTATMIRPRRSLRTSFMFILTWKPSPADVLGPGLLRHRELLQHRLGLLERDARISDALAVNRGASRHVVLTAFDQMALQHHTEDPVRA